MSRLCGPAPATSLSLVATLRDNSCPSPANPYLPAWVARSLAAHVSAADRVLAELACSVARGAPAPRRYTVPVSVSAPLCPLPLYDSDSALDRHCSRESLHQTGGRHCQRCAATTRALIALDFGIMLHSDRATYMYMHVFVLDTKYLEPGHKLMSSLASSPARIHAVVPSHLYLEEVEVLEGPFEVASSEARILVARFAGATMPRLAEIPFARIGENTQATSTAHAQHAIATHVCWFLFISCVCVCVCVCICY